MVTHLNGILNIEFYIFSTPLKNFKRSAVVPLGAFRICLFINIEHLYTHTELDSK